MASWTRLQEHARGNFALEDDQPSMFSMTWIYDDGRRQKVIIRRYEAFGRTMIEIKSPFARGDAASADELIRKNAELPLATIARSGELYLAVYNMLIDHLNLEDFDLVVSRVAAVADTLEETYNKTDEF